MQIYTHIKSGKSKIQYDGLLCKETKQNTACEI